MKKSHVCFGLDDDNYYIIEDDIAPLYHLMKRGEFIVLFIRYCPFCGEKLDADL